MIGKGIFLLAVLAAFGAANARAAMKGTHNKPRIRPLGSGLAREFSVPREEVLRLRDRGLSRDEIRRALAKKTGRPVGESAKKKRLTQQRDARHRR